MQQQEVPGKPFQEESESSSWSPPAPPRMGMRARGVLCFERYGFELLCALLLVVIAYLYVNADRLATAVQTTISEASEPPAGAVNVSAEVVDSSAVLSLSIATTPAGASIFIDNAFVGISPLRGIATGEGAHRVTVQKPDYIPLDTVLTFKDTGASLQVTLHAGKTPRLAVSGQAVSGKAVPPTAPAGPDQPVRDQSPLDSARPAAEGAHESKAVAQQQPAPLSTERLSGATPVDEPAGADEEPAIVPGKETVARPVEAPRKASTSQVGELEITSQPAGASVSIEGAVVGVTPLVLAEVDAGSQTVAMQLEGYEPFTMRVAVEAQQRQTVNATLAPLFGRLKILARPWGTIYIDGTLHKSETDIWYTTELTPGFHRVRVEHATLGRWEQVVDVTAGDELPVTIDFNENASGVQ